MVANPFDFQRPVSGPAFMNREKELEALTRFCAGGVNVLLVSPRRLGKSSLIHEAFRRLDARRFLCLYVDVLTAVDEGEVADRILTELGRVAFGRLRRGWVSLVEELKQWRPAYTLDPRTGLPSIALQKVDAGLPNFELVLRRLEKTALRRRRRLVVAVDEFQTIMERPDGARSIAVMRSIVQFQRNVSYVLSGSKKHVLLGLVRDPDNPFWQQLELLEIGGIPFRHFRTTVRRTFSRSGRPVADDALARIEEVCGENPKRIQELLFDLFEAGKPATRARVDEILDAHLAAQRHRFEDLLSDVKEGPQKRLLVALAREGPPDALLGQAFLSKHGLGLPATVRYAARVLREKGLIDDANRFVDPYLRHYLTRF